MYTLPELLLSPQHSPSPLPSAPPSGPAMASPSSGFFIPVSSLPLSFLMLGPGNHLSPSNKSTPLLPPVHGIKACQSLLHCLAVVPRPTHLRPCPIVTTGAMLPAPLPEVKIAGGSITCVPHQEHHYDASPCWCRHSPRCVFLG